MRVYLTRNGERRPVRGPADLGEIEPGDVLTVSGTPSRDWGVARWAGAIGSAVLEGASVVRR